MAKKRAKKQKMIWNILDKVSMVLIAVGGINWGLIGALDFNVVDKLIGDVVWLENGVYILVGVSAVYFVVKGVVKGLK